MDIQAEKAIIIEQFKQVNDETLIQAFKNLKFSVDKSFVTNLSSINVFIKMKGEAFNIEPGSTRLLD